MRGLLFAAAAALLLAGAGRAQEPPRFLPVDEVEQRRINGAAVIGRLIYDYDQAAWITTDAMMARIPRDRFPPDGGWVVEPRGDGALAVTYYGVRDGAGFILFVGVAKGGKVVEEYVFAEADHIRLSPLQQRMVDARRIALTRIGGAGHNPCANAAFNIVTLAPPSPDDPVTLYFLTPQVERGVYPFGGHFRIDVDKSGKIVADRPFTNSCIALSPRDAGSGPPVSGFITHLLDPTPTEIHVFLSLWTKLPIFVATGDRRTWWVSGTRIGLVENPAQDSGKR